MSSVLWDPNPFSHDRASRDEIALFLAKATLAAGPAVMEEYERGCDVASKADGSPVTSADRRAEVIICERLASIAPKLPVCAEEAVAAGGRAQVAEQFLLVDPLDGTREFLAGNGEFTINVALIERGAPIAGAVYAPAIGRLWVGGETAFTCDAAAGAALPDEGSRRRIRTRRAPTSLIAFASRSHLDANRTPFSRDCRLARRNSPVPRSSFASSPRALATSIPGSRQRWNGTRRRATRFCARRAAAFSILQDDRFCTERPRADCATARSSPGATLRPPSDWDAKIIARGFVGDKLNL